MPVPDNFSPVEQFQDVNKRLWNKLVREYFRDITGLENDLDLTTPRQALLKACLHLEDDPLPLTIGRMLLFLNATNWLKNQTSYIFGQVVEQIDESVEYRPKIVLYFREDEEDAEPGYQPLPLEISFRLMDETSTSITKNKLIAIGNKIKTAFGTGQGYVHRKGRRIAYYNDKLNGCKFQVHCREEQDGKNLIREALSIIDKTIDETKLNYNKIDNEADAFPYNPGFHNVLGKRIEKPRRRVITNVRFRYSYVKLWSKGQPIYLYSRTHALHDVLVPV